MVVSPVGWVTDLLEGGELPWGMILHAYPINYAQGTRDELAWDLAIGRTLCSVISTYTGLYNTDGFLLCQQGAYRSFQYGGILVAVMARVGFREALAWLSRIRDIAEIDASALRFGEECVRCFWCSEWWKAMDMPDPPKPPELITFDQEYTNGDDEYNPYPRGGYVKRYREDGVPTVTRKVKRRP